MSITKLVTQIIFGVPLAALALLVLFAGATIIIGLACLSLWVHVVCNGVSAIWKSVKLI